MMKKNLLFFPFIVLLLQSLSSLFANGQLQSPSSLSPEYYKEADNLWPEMPIPYSFAQDDQPGALTGQQKGMITMTLATISLSVPCVKFKLLEQEEENVQVQGDDLNANRTPNTNTTLITNDDGAVDSNNIISISSLHFISVSANFCDASFIGFRKNERNLIRLGGKCHEMSTYFRLILHALGLYLEHQRPDRSKFIHVNYENVRAECRVAFEVVPMDARILQVPYDVTSVMQLRNDACSRWPHVMTMEFMQAPWFPLGSDLNPSFNDYRKLANLYCNGSTTAQQGSRPRQDQLPIRRFVAGKMTILLWPNNEIPFEIDSQSFQYWQHNRLIEALNLINRRTCVKFVDRKAIRNRNYDDFIEFKFNSTSDNEGYLASHFGYFEGQGKRTVYLGGQSFPLYESKKLLYWTLLSTIGILPEHRRTDRDKHVRIHWQNIDHGLDWGFDIFQPLDTRLMWTPYDVTSIMHPTIDYFSKKPRKLTTITPLDSTLLDKVGRSERPNINDLAKINNLYCYGQIPASTAVPTLPTISTTTTTTVTTPKASTTVDYDVYYWYYYDDEASNATTTTAKSQNSTSTTSSQTTSRVVTKAVESATAQSASATATTTTPTISRVSTVANTTIDSEEYYVEYYEYYEYYEDDYEAEDGGGGRRRRLKKKQTKNL